MNENFDKLVHFFDYWKVGSEIEQNWIFLGIFRFFINFKVYSRSDECCLPKSALVRIIDSHFLSNWLFSGYKSCNWDKKIQKWGKNHSIYETPALFPKVTVCNQNMFTTEYALKFATNVNSSWNIYHRARQNKSFASLLDKITIFFYKYYYLLDYLYSIYFLVDKKLN